MKDRKHSEVFIHAKHESFRTTKYRMNLFTKASILERF